MGGPGAPQSWDLCPAGPALTPELPVLLCASEGRRQLTVFLTIGTSGVKSGKTHLVDIFISVILMCLLKHPLILFLNPVSSEGWFHVVVL